MPGVRLLVLAFLSAPFMLAGVAATHAPGAEASAAAVDSDHDGLSDELEQELLVRFAPQFQTDPQDCAGAPRRSPPIGRIQWLPRKTVRSTDRQHPAHSQACMIRWSSFATSIKRSL